MAIMDWRMGRRGILILFFLCLFLNPNVVAQEAPAPLVPGRAVERELTGGESHSYEVTLAAGQFAQFRIEQRQLDAALILSGPDGAQLAEMNAIDGGPESLSHEAAISGAYRLVVRSPGARTLRGSYRLELVTRPAATAEDRRFLVAQAALLEGMALSKPGSRTLPRAIEKFEQALPLWRGIGVPFWIAITLNKHGRAYMILGQNDKAVPIYEQALATAREFKDLYNEGVAHNGLANAHFNARRFEQSAESFDRSAAAFREAKYPRWEGLCIYSRGNAYLALNRQEQAAASYEASLPILREVGDRMFEAQALTSLGNVHLNRGQMDKAVAVTEAAIAIQRELGDRAMEGRSLNNLAIFYSRLGQPAKSIEILQNVLKLFRELKDRANENATVLALGFTYGGMGETEKAIDYFEQGLAFSRELKDLPREVLCLTNLGLAYQFLSRYEKAIEYLEQALAIMPVLGDRRREGDTLGNLGTVYFRLNRYEKAIEAHEKSLTLFRETGYRLGEGNELQNLGNVFRLLGREEKAIEYYEQSLPIFREAKYRIGEADSLSNLGGALERLDRLEEASRALEQALAILREEKYRLGEASALQALAMIQYRQNQPARALELYQEALAIFREVKNREYEGQMLFRIGEVKLSLKESEEAARYIADSIAVFREVGTPHLESSALTLLATSERDRGQFEQALATVGESLRIAESLRAELISPESRASFLKGIQEAYHLQTDLLMRLHQATPDRAMNARALEVSERQRARSMLDLLTESGTDLREGVDVALLTRERELAQQLSSKAQQLMRAANPARTTALKQEIGQLESELERAQAAIRKASPNYAALTQPQPLTLAEIQNQLDADTLLLEYSLGPERSYLWAVTKESLTSYALPAESAIDARAREVYELLTARGAGPRGETPAARRERIARAESRLTIATRELSRLILGPVASLLGGKRLVIVADGPLQYIPFAMLPDPAIGAGKPEQPLIVGREVVSLPSASALAIQRAELAGRAPAPRMLAVIADPVFDSRDVRFAAPPSDADDPAAQLIAIENARSIEHLAATADSGKSGPAPVTRRLVIPRLPYTRQEADRLLALAPKDESLRALDFRANRATALSPDLRQYRYVHFATHGVLDAERPGLSSLVLSLVDEQGKAQDGFLRANDIYNLKLPAELVVLSACQTGLGKEIRGEGLVGLTRGFMYAGAARVVVSLWSVNDRATADLMTTFYQKMLRQGERPAAALRAAQIEMWNRKQWRSPYYWAAFTLQGEWR